MLIILFIVTFLVAAVIGFGVGVMIGFALTCDDPKPPVRK